MSRAAPSPVFFLSLCGTPSARWRHSRYLRPLSLESHIFLHLRESPDTESIRRDFTALPPGKTAEDKYFLGYFRENRLCAVLDLIAGYPDNETAFIGWFLLDGSLHRKGIGSAMMRELFDALKKASFRSIRLGFVEGNSESEGFWRSLGFSPTGKKSPQEAYTVIVAARDLD